MIYIDTDITVRKDGVALFQVECECRVTYELPDGRRGPVEWEVIEFYFSDPTQKAYTKITPTEPLFAILYKDLDLDFVHARLIDILVDNEVIDR